MDGQYNELPRCEAPGGCIRMAAPTCRRSGVCLYASYREGYQFSETALWIDVGILGTVLEELRVQDHELARLDDDGGPPAPESV